ncbi:MAG: glutamyl-tRNA(Gln) amidotransferase subunit A, aspartyl-tRNA(Asn)/glutamyl-tRNA (Gln) amidotransferase subunit A [candidate division WWE3 bacterium GW2011_GWC1_42_102]|nr:MAG: glutamyl-tRNA(Gln) amidotransferase subunit A, aspartyl-tRNA(Asn)/glutamyl-tRNA (Gln) amidotransferase subunit A [candidate division WWE3 bacterium GW2011_GWC1_42_102]
MLTTQKLKTGISVPCGFYNGLPVGVQIMSRINEESKIFGALFNYQGATAFHLEKPALIKE